MNNQRKTYLWIAAVIIVTASLIWWSQQNKKDSFSGETIKVGGAIGLSGVCAEWGEGELKSIQMAFDEANNEGGINGKELELVVEDTQCDNQSTVNAVNKLIHADKVQVILGPTWGDSFQGQYPLMRQAKVVGISPSTAMEALEFQKVPVDYVFSTYFPERTEVDILQQHAAKQNLKRVTIINDQDPFAAMMADLFKTQAGKNGITITGEHEVTTGTTDFRTVITKIKNESPDAVFASLPGAGAKVVFYKQAQELGLKAQVLSSADIQDEATLKSFASVMEGIIYTYPKNTGSYQDFLSKYQTKYKTAPLGPVASNAYDAARVLIATLKTGAQTGDEIQTELLKIKVPGTFVKEVSFTKKHQITSSDFEVKTVKNGTFTAP